MEFVICFEIFCFILTSARKQISESWKGQRKLIWRIQKNENILIKHFYFFFGKENNRNLEQDFAPDESKQRVQGTFKKVYLPANREARKFVSERGSEKLFFVYLAEEDLDLINLSVFSTEMSSPCLAWMRAKDNFRGETINLCCALNDIWCNEALLALPKSEKLTFKANQNLRLALRWRRSVDQKIVSSRESRLSTRDNRLKVHSMRRESCKCRKQILKLFSFLAMSSIASCYCWLKPADIMLIFTPLPGKEENE